MEECQKYIQSITLQYVKSQVYSGSMVRAYVLRAVEK